MQSYVLDGVTNDTLIWGQSDSGQYTAKSGYLWLTENHFQSLSAIGVRWSWVWKVVVPENIKHFLWLICHNSLPTNDFRVSRHISSDASCHRCGAAYETGVHVLRDCVLSKKIWAMLHLDQDQNFYTSDFNAWLKKFIVDSDESLVIVVCWIIWKARNAVTFVDNKWNDWYLLNQIHSLHDLINQSLGKKQSSHVPRKISWIPPAENWVKVNVDGSSFGNPGKSGFGGLIRNRLGEWITGFSGFCGITSILNAKLLAIYHGLNLAWTNGQRLVVCESDSQLALDLISKGVDVFHPYASVINQIRAFKSYSWTLIFQHTLRQGNECVDWLAKHGAFMDHYLLLREHYPAQLHLVLLADAVGFSRLRP